MEKHCQLSDRIIGMLAGMLDFLAFLRRRGLGSNLCNLVVLSLVICRLQLRLKGHLLVVVQALMALRSLIGLNSSICKRLQNVCQADSALERLRIHFQTLLLDPELADYIKDLDVLREEVAEALSSQESRSSQDERELDVER